ncbi:MAG: glycosyltransferase family 4 protein [Saprospiraceae bacterium]|nr:glycosyltransferase family 4 protein [Saprospiraceae bacterium]
MRILLVLEYYHPNIGGLEKLFKSLVDELDAQGHEITILTNKIRAGQNKVQRAGNVTIYRYNFFNRYLFTILAFFPALRLARQADLIQTTSYNAGVPAFFAARLTGKKVCITFHEVWLSLWHQLPFFGRISKWLHYGFEWSLLRLPFDKFIAVSGSTKEALVEAGVHREKVSLIYNGIDYQQLKQVLADPIPSSQRDTYTFLYFGRLGISKGLDVLIKALHFLKQRQTQFRLMLIIPPKPASLSRRIHAMVDEWQVGVHIQFLSELTEEHLFQQVLHSDAVVIPSYNEGFCFTAVETVALDKPIISSGRGALKEVVGGKFLTFADQDPKALANSMEMAMQGKWQWKEKKTFHLSETVAAYIACYEDLLG